MSDTPRTDAFVESLHTEFSNVATDFLKMVAFASNLERELAKAKPCGICGSMFFDARNGDLHD